MIVTLAQIAPKLGINNIDLHLEAIAAHKDHADLIIFPELSLHGYSLQDKVYEIAADTEMITPLIEASKEIDIIFGMAYTQNRAIYNAALYLSGGEVKHRHFKNILANYGMFEEARYFVKGTNLEPFETSMGSSMLIVCEDLWQAEVMAKIAHIKPVNLFVVANSPARDFEAGELLIERQWDALLKSTALLANCNVIFVNRVGFEDGLGFWGGSRIISPSAETLFEMPLFETSLDSFDLKRNNFRAKQMIMKHG